METSYYVVQTTDTPTGTYWFDNQSIYDTISEAYDFIRTAVNSGRYGVGTKFRAKTVTITTTEFSRTVHEEWTIPVVVTQDLDYIDDEAILEKSDEPIHS